VPSILLWPTNLALVNLDDLIRTIDLLGAALQELEYGFIVEDTPLSDRMVTEVKFFFDLVDSAAADDVVRNNYNFQECEITQVEPTAVPKGYLNPSERTGSADRVISRSQILHCTLLPMTPTSLRN
jgi:hypothetical protein